MPEIVGKYLSILATQGGADAFVQQAITTNLIPSDGYAYKIIGVDLCFTDASGLQAISADSSLVMSLTRDTKTAVAEYSDPDTIWRDGTAFSLTTSGQLAIPQRHDWAPPFNAYIVEPTIYFQLDSAATGCTSTIAGRLYYEEVKLSEVEILRLLNNA
jgi:hypothetical protein